MLQRIRDEAHRFAIEYHRKLRIEGEIALEIATSMILPIAASYYGRLSADLASAAQGKLKAGTAGLRRLADQVGAGIDRLDAASDALRKAIAAHNPRKTLAAMTGLRDVVDALELLVDDACWPLPKYREMLFIY